MVPDLFSQQPKLPTSLTDVSFFSFFFFLFSFFQPRFEFPSPHLSHMSPASSEKSTFFLPAQRRPCMRLTCTASEESARLVVCEYSYVTHCRAHLCYAARTLPVRTLLGLVDTLISSTLASP